MAVRDVDDIIAVEHLNKINEKKKQDQIALNAISMLYQSRIEEANRENLKRAEEQAKNMKSSASSESEEDISLENLKPLEDLEPIKDELLPIKEELVEITPEHQEELKKKAKKEDNKVLSGLSNFFTNKIAEKKKSVKSKDGKKRKTINDYETEQIYEALNHKESTLTDAEKKAIHDRRVEASKGFDVKRAVKPYRKKKTKKQERLQGYIPLVIGVILAICLSIYLGLVSSSYKASYMETSQTNTGGFSNTVSTTNEELTPLSALVQGFINSTPVTLKGFDGKYFFTIFAISIFVSGAGVALIWTNSEDKKRRREGHEHGSFRLATPTDIRFFKKRFMDKNPKNNMIYGSEIGLSIDNTFSERTANILIIGGTGTGKTFKYVKPNILQHNCSMIITDPSGDIFRSFSGYLLEQGFNVYIFNINDMDSSNFYNPLMNVYDAKGDINEVKVDILVDLYMKNAKNGQEQGSSDPFWDKAEKAFLTALIYYVLENDDIEPYDKCFNTILRKAQDAKAENESGKKATETKLTTEIRSWQKEMESKGKSIKTPLYYDTFLIAPDKTANTILITTAVDLQLFATKEVDRITRTNEQYPDFNIDFDTIAQIQTYVFLCIPQTHEAYNFLISMFYSQLYGRLYDYGDKIATKQYFIEAEFGIPLFKGFDSFEEAEEFRLNVTKDDIVEVDYINGTKLYKVAWNGKVYRTSVNKDALLRLIDNLGHTKVMKQADMFHGDPALPIHVNCLLDEFKNIGEIPRFLNILATSRKYRIGSSVIVQGLSQLKTMYKDEEYNTLLGNCDTLIFLGSPNVDDKEFIQKSLGKTTILQRSVSTSKTGNSVSYTPTEVDLMSIDEIEDINNTQKNRDDCIIIIRDYRAFIDRKYFLFDHPNWNKVQDYKKKCDDKKFDPNLYFLNNAENEIFNI